MTRFLITLEDGVKTVMFALKNQQGGEIFVPKLPSIRITQICQVLNRKKN